MGHYLGACLILTRPFIWAALLSFGLMKGFGLSETYFFVLFVVYVGLFTGGTSAFSICWALDRGLLKLWSVYGISQSVFIAGKFFFSISLCILVYAINYSMLLIFDIGGIVQQQFVSASIAFSLLLIIVFGSALGIFIASFIRRLDLFGIIINAVLFPLLFTSGAFYKPGAALGIVQFISNINPLHWLVSILNSGLAGSTSTTLNLKVWGATAMLSLLMLVVSSGNLKRKT